MKSTVRIESVRKVFDNGEHNAFTDLCRFRGELYLTFRTCPDGHGVNPTSRIVVMMSVDGSVWAQVCEFGVPGRDTRDPHFLVFKDTLFVYTGTWLCEEKLDINNHLGYCSWSADGAKWNGPRMLEGTSGHYIWRAAAYGETAYLCGRRKREFAVTDHPGDGSRVTESAMLESDDGFVWRPVGLFQEERGDETAFLFEEDGEVLALARDGERLHAQVCRSRPPYKEWTRVDLDRQVGGPLLVKWGDRYLVGGRKTVGDQPAVMAIYWLVENRLEEIADLPSGGDCSYPGFVQMSDDEALLSYYSSHERDPASIYLTTLKLA